MQFFNKKNKLDPKDRKKLKEEYLEILKKNGCEPARDNIQDFYFNRKIKDNTVLISGLGRSVRGSMQYILNELNSNEDFKDFKIYVRTDKDLTDDVVKEYIERNNWKRTVAVNSHLGRYMESCKYLITESYFPYEWVKKPGQIMIDLWHGTPLKNLGVLKNGDKCHKTSIQQKNFLCADYLLYPNEFTRNVMWDSYKITSLLSAKALNMGYPRTSGMLKAKEYEAESIRKEIAPNGERVYAYMPTFRGYLSDEEAIARETELLDYLDGELKDDQILYVNLHHHIKEGLDCDKYKHIKLFPPLIDSYSLLAATDALISDYSSVFFDYLVLQKQIILYIEDYETYRSYQGLNIDIDELPFDLARTKDQIISMLETGKTYDDSEIFTSMCSNDAADNPEKFCRLFLSEEEGINITEIPSNDKGKVLLYAEGLAAGRDTDKLEEITKQYDKEKYEVYIGCDESKVAKNMRNDQCGAYPMLHDSLLISSKDKFVYSSIGAPLIKLYKEGKIPFKKAFKFLQYEYAMVSKRMYGDTVFDVLAVYDALKPETILGMALSDANVRLLFISDRMEEKLIAGNSFLADAIKQSAKYFSAIIVDSNSKREIMNSSLGMIHRNKIKTIESPEEILDLISEMCKRK